MNSVEQIAEQILRAQRAALDVRLGQANNFTAVKRAVEALRAALAAEVTTRSKQLDQVELVALQSQLTAQGDAWVLAAMEKQLAALTELARRDAVTGIGNRAAFNARLHEELARAHRYGRSLALALLDVDGFKSVNDRLGHPAGDRLLASLANTLQASLRSSDALFRYGGDEFAALSPETAAADLAAALQRAEQHRRAGDSLGASITMSYGVASFPQDATNKDELIQLADQRLYAAKRARQAKQNNGKPHIH